MTDWNPQNIHPSMRVYTLDGHELGHIAKVYEDSFLVHKGYFFPTDRYIPYSAIDSVENDRVQLSMSATNIAMRSSDLRQTISELTTKHTTSRASVSTSVDAA